jgi:predicted Zn finger-like uncharacterized protein
MLDHVEVFCPHCFVNYFVSPERIPEDGVATPCKKCGRSFTMVKASGDPIRDRASRQQGFLVVQAKKHRLPDQEPDGNSSTEVPQNRLGASALSGLFKKKGFKIGVCAAGAVFVIVIGAFYFWKSSVHSRFEKGFRHTLAQSSNSRFEFKIERLKFSAFGGLSTDSGCLYGFALSDREARKILWYADKVHFQIDPSRKQLVTQPFTLRINVDNSRIVFNGCVVEACGADGWQATFRAVEATAEIEGAEVLTGKGIEAALDFKGGEWAADPRFLLGHAGLTLKAKQVESISASVTKDADIRFTLKNGLFPKQGNGAQAGSLNFAETMKTKWAESQATASIDRCSLSVLGSTVQLAGKLEFRKPPDETDLDLSFHAKDFSRIMKFIHRVNSDTFDRIVLALVDLEDKNVSLYAPGTDCLDLNFSYKTSRIKLNEKGLKPLT